MEGVDLEPVGVQQLDPVAVARMMLDPASGPRDPSDVALGPQQPVAGDTTFIGYAQGDRDTVGQEHQSTLGRRSRAASASQSAVAPRRGAVLTHDEVERATTQRNLAGVGFHQWEEHLVLSLAPAGRVQLGGAQVDADRACTGASESGRQEGGATAEFDDVETSYVADQSELGFGQTEQAPPDPVRCPLVLGVGVREPLVHQRPEVPMTGEVRSSGIHGAILTRSERHRHTMLTSGCSSAAAGSAYSSSMSDSRPFHMVKFKASHNSFERDERPVTEQLVWSSSQPHQAGAAASSSTFGSRRTPLVVERAPRRVPGRADAQLVEYLRHLRMWSRFEARHDVITISLDLKAQARNRRQFLAGSTPPSRSSSVVTGFTPAELMGSASSLVAGAMASGWPTLEELRGRFILVLSGDEPTKASYAGSGRNRLCFADQRLGDGDARLSLTEDRVFFNLNATEDWDWHGALRWFARQPGFITRAYVANSVDLWSRLLAADANIPVDRQGA